MNPVPLLELCRQYRIGKGARSSRAERPAHNRLVGGSNPPGPTTGQSEQYFATRRSM